MDSVQLLTWWMYLDAVEGEGDVMTTYSLFERCLVPCASYPGMCSRLVHLFGSCTSPMMVASNFQEAQQR
jgi:hypothetical protein